MVASKTCENTESPASNFPATESASDLPAIKSPTPEPSSAEEERFPEAATPVINKDHDQDEPPLSIH